MLVALPGKEKGLKEYRDRLSETVRAAGTAYQVTSLT